MVLDPKKATQISTAIGGANQAVDRNAMSASCTRGSASHEWWSIDLGAVYNVSTVTVTLPRNFRANLSKYRLLFSKN